MDALIKIGPEFRRRLSPTRTARFMATDESQMSPASHEALPLPGQAKHSSLPQRRTMLSSAPRMKPSTHAGCCRRPSWPPSLCNLRSYHRLFYSCLSADATVADLTTTVTTGCVPLVRTWTTGCTNAATETASCVAKDHWPLFAPLL